MTQQQTQRHRRADQSEEPEKTGILSQVSLPSAAASSLAAVTSFLLSAKLGITGSLIGAGVAAAVSTTASQLYNAMIKRSVETVQDMSGHGASMASAGETTQVATVGGRTMVRRAPVRLADLEATEVLASTGSPVAPHALRTQAARQHGTSLARRTFAVALTAALVTLAVYGVAVHAATRGRGIGPTTLAPLDETVEQPIAETDAGEKTPAAEDGATAEPTQTTVITSSEAVDEGPAEATTAPTAQEQDSSATPSNAAEGADGTAAASQQGMPSQEGTDAAAAESDAQTQTGQSSTGTGDTTTGNTAASQPLSTDTQ